MFEFFDWIVTKLSVYASLFAAVFSIWAVIKLYRQQIQLKKLNKKVYNTEDLTIYITESENINTLNPVALCLSLLPDDRATTIKPRVDQFLKQKFNKEIPIDEINMDGIKTQDDRIKLVEVLKQKRREYEVKCATEMHLFIAGPVTAGVIAGAMFKNWIPVKIYGSDDGPAFYQYWMTIPKQL